MANKISKYYFLWPCNTAFSLGFAQEMHILQLILNGASILNYSDKG